MLDLIALLDTPGPKGFFQSPSYLLGTPLVILGIIGVLIALSPIELRWPQAPAAAGGEVHLPGAEGHPSAATYVQVGIVLAIVTVVEVAFYYLDLAQGALLGILLVLSTVKFLLVVMWFMHLRFDNRIFSTFFAGGMLLVITLFIVVLTSLGAGLI